MPQPFRPKKDEMRLGGARGVEQRPEHAVKIAAIAAAWTRIEHQMAQMFGSVTGDTRMTAPDTVSHLGNNAAMAALGAIQSLPTRISVFRAATQTILSETESAEFEKLISELRSRAGERNDVIHGDWIVVDRLPKHLLLNVSTAKTPDRYLQYTVADLEQIIVRILALQERLQRFADEHMWGRMMGLMHGQLRPFAPKAEPQND